MFWLKGIAGIIGFLAFLELIAFIFDILWAIPFGAMLTTATVFVLGIYALGKLANHLLNKIEGK